MTTIVIDVLYVQLMVAAKAAAAAKQGLSPVELVIGRTQEGEFVAITHGLADGSLSYGSVNVMMKAASFGFNPMTERMTVLCCHPAQVAAKFGKLPMVCSDAHQGATKVWGNSTQGAVNVSQFQVGEWVEVCTQAA